MVLEFSSNWQDWLCDPYAVLGIPVTADPPRIMKRYRTLAKMLHPDRYGNADPQVRDWVTQILARLVNPAYAKIKDDLGQREILALVRLQALQNLKDGVPVRSAIARSLMQQSVQSTEIFYEQQVSRIAETLYDIPESVGDRIQDLLELNLVYLQLKQGESPLRQRRTGLMTPDVSPPPIRPAVTPISHEPLSHEPLSHEPLSHEPLSGPLNGSMSGPLSNGLGTPHHYAQRHYDRAKHYAQTARWKESIQELKDAIRLDPSCSSYHALMGFIYLKQEQMGMARVYFKQALKLNPEDKLAKRFSQYLPKPAESLQEQPKAEVKPVEKRGLFGRFRR
jgi:tetratricopeptide (TPR) repeat protein